MGKKNDDIPGKRFGRLTLAQVIPARKKVKERLGFTTSALDTKEITGGMSWLSI